MPARILILAAFVAPIAGCGTPRGGEQVDCNFENLKPLVAGIQQAQTVVLYEGLPHQYFESQSLAVELKAKPTVQLHRFPFYQETLPLKEEDGKQLTALLAATTSFRERPSRGVKACGGYHPDYCVEWRDGSKLYRVLFCFGCCEVQIFGPRHELYCDMQSDAQKKFESILKPYRKNRPPYSRDPAEVE